MGNCCCKDEPLAIKDGVLLSEIKDKIKPLDLIAFRGDDTASMVVYKHEEWRQRAKRNNGYIFTHVGIIVTTDVMDHPLMEQGRLYIFESTFSQTGVRDIYGKLPFGVQIRDLETVINDYDKSNETSIAWCPLLRNPCSREDVKTIMNHLYETTKGKTWDANCWSLGSALFPFLRPCRCCAEHLFLTQDWLFCSELVAMVYKELGVLPNNVNPKDVVPDDLVNAHNDTDTMPVIDCPPTLITTEQHCRRQTIVID